MPIYEYECQACGRVFERLQGMSEPAPETCGHCGHGPVRRLISRSGFVLKGSGFYTTEHPSASRRAAGKAEAKPAESKASEAPAPSKPTENK